MLITGRQARAMLLEAGVSDRRARIALSCGLAGTPLRTPACQLYDAERVRDLGRREQANPFEILERCPDGFVISRRPVRVDVAPEVLREQVSEIPGEISPWTALRFAGKDLVPGGTAFIATVAGFVVLGATIAERHGRRLVLEEPGEWYAGLAGTQLRSGNGRQWRVAYPLRAGR